VGGVVFLITSGGSENTPENPPAEPIDDPPFPGN
jgi:hypothetical protein